MLSHSPSTTVIGYLGIHVSKANLDVLLLNGIRREGRRFANTPEGFEKLHQWIGRRLKAEAVHVCLEATGWYSEAVARNLLERGYPVSVVNPARIKKYGESQLQRNKTDKLDAALIADYCRRMQPPRWVPPTPEVRELQGLVRHLEDLLQARRQTANRLEATRTESPVTAHLQAQLALLETQIVETKQMITTCLDEHPDFRAQKTLLRSIPGLGILTIARLIAACRDLRTFTDAGQLVAFAGLNPRQHQSGNSVAGPASISRTDSASLYAALYMPAITAMTHNPLIRAFATRLRERGVRGKAVVAAAMRKLLHLVVGVLKSGRPFDPCYSGGV
jgi:transposase